MLSAATRKSTTQTMDKSPNTGVQSARERFIAAVNESGGSKLVAKRLGCSRSYIDMIKSGDRRPGMVTALAIEETFGIRMQDWVEPGTLAGRPRRTRRS